VSKRNTFEEDMEKLEALVATLERNDLGLEESLKAFEDGTKLVGKLTKALEKAEKRVLELTRDGQGEFELADFDAAGDDDDD